MRSTLAVITGASRGIGAAIALAAEDDGARVAVCNRAASAFGRQLTTDLSRPESWTIFDDWLQELVGELSPERLVFVHNAATLTPMGFAGDVDPDGYRSNVLLNSAAPQVLGDAVVRLARETATPTVIIQLSSGAGKTAYPGWSSYCAAKAAVDMWVRTVGAEQAERDDLVRVLALGPGVVATAMQAQIRATEADAFPQVERFRELHANEQLADPDEVGQRIWEIAVGAEWENGAVHDLRDLE